MLQSVFLSVLLALGPSSVLANPDSNDDIPPAVTGVVSSALNLASSYASEYSTIPPDAASAVSSALSLASSYDSYGNSVASSAVSSALSLASSYASEYGGGGDSTTTGTTSSTTSTSHTTSGATTGSHTTVINHSTETVAGATATSASASADGAAHNKVPFGPIKGGTMAVLGSAVALIGGLAIAL